jgi:hypothetical protein
MTKEILISTTWATDTEEIHPDLKTKLKRILMLTHFARCQSDYEFLDKYGM